MKGFVTSENSILIVAQNFDDFYSAIVADKS